MESRPKQKIVSIPTDDEITKAFEAYTIAVGKVAYSWNFLHETLARLFRIVVASDAGVALAIWYSTNNDRSQRQMLRGAVKAARSGPIVLVTEAKAEVIWLLDQADKLAIQRNDAIHAPASLYAGSPDGSAEMGPAWLNGHPLAKKLMGKRLLQEFDLYERSAEQLARYSQKLETAITFSERYPWPPRPKMPKLRSLSIVSGPQVRG